MGANIGETTQNMLQFFEVRCYAISNLHKQGVKVKIISMEFFPGAVDYEFTCGHSVRLNLKPEFWETKNP